MRIARHGAVERSCENEQLVRLVRLLAPTKKDDWNASECSEFEEELAVDELVYMTLCSGECTISSSKFGALGKAEPKGEKILAAC